MIIGVNTDKNERKRYYLLEVAKGEKFGAIANFDTFSKAAIVLRYLKGANMPQTDQEKALQYIFEWDEKETKNDESEQE